MFWYITRKINTHTRTIVVRQHALSGANFQAGFLDRGVKKKKTNKKKTSCEASVYGNTSRRRATIQGYIYTFWPTIVFLPQRAGSSTEALPNINHCTAVSREQYYVRFFFFPTFFPDKYLLTGGGIVIRTHDGPKKHINPYFYSPY